MNRFRIPSIVSAALLLALVMTAVAGGWAVVTVKTLPEYLVAGKPEALTFLIRQHGFTLSSGLNPTLSASATGALNTNAVVTPTGNPGEYKAVLSVPQAGDWTIRINSLFGDSVLLPIRAVRADGPAPPALSQAGRGEQLFVAKGCIACHVNKEVAVDNQVSVGPDLTGKKLPGDFLKKFLADPAKTMGKEGSDAFGMPNLGLAKEEIDAIEAFINRDRRS